MKYFDGENLMIGSSVTALIFVLTATGAVGQGKKTDVPPQPKQAPGEILVRTLELTNKSRKDNRFGGNYAMWLPVTFVEGKSYQIDMEGISLGVLRLEDPDHKHVDSNFNGAGSNRPRIIHQAKSSGKFWIICTSMHFRPETGRFTVRVKEVTSDPKELAKPIELKVVKGQASVDAELEMRGPRYKDNPRKFVTITFEAGVTYQIDMNSGEFLSYVSLEGPDGKLIAEKKVKAGEGGPASITHKADTTGTYRIIAAQHDFRTGGPQFHLSVRALVPEQK
jgi:hypothetical protein